MKRALIVGGGPVGALSATHLASQGWAVTVSPPKSALPWYQASYARSPYCVVLRTLASLHACLGTSLASPMACQSRLGFAHNFHLTQIWKSTDFAEHGTPIPCAATTTTTPSLPPMSSVPLTSLWWQVLEKLGMLPTRPARDDPRAYCLMLGPRGLGALLQAGVDLAAVTAPSNGLLGMPCMCTRSTQGTMLLSRCHPSGFSTQQGAKCGVSVAVAM